MAVIFPPLLILLPSLNQPQHRDGKYMASISLVYPPVSKTDLLVHQDTFSQSPDSPESLSHTGLQATVPN